MEIQYKIFKLKNGDSIISEVNLTTDNTINLHRPMMYKIVTMMDEKMNTSDLILFRNWAEFSKHQNIEISPDMIGASYTPDEVITNCYEMEKLKQDMPELYKMLKKDDPALPMHGDEKPMLPGPMPGQNGQQTPPNMANFNLTIPIDVAKNLIDFLEEEGVSLIGPDIPADISEDENFMDDFNKDISSNESRTEDPPFGNHPDDWSPDPNDYLK